ncbi:SH3 domain-containing kinase-binding protein 1 isoform X4 [Callorhinchus milii]|uniref:SH3 domain-containing kinase-binding protein 1 isoform X4 n=1 Tax=Callorhinchus milii TaxID=7868 RepID=UPI001C3F8295|nr:SH3 domain-containing kinase-binding protein 1 isoform X4 [Callorhinchus milii]
MVEAIVEFDYKGQQDDELTISVGEVVTNIEKKDGGWWEGELGGRRGLFPDNFVREIKGVKKEHHITVKPTEMLGSEFPNGSPVSSSDASLKSPRKAEQNRRRRCKAVFSYAPQNEDELELKIGDIIDILGEVEEGWWEGVLNGKTGMFPSNFITSFADEQEEMTNTQEDTGLKMHVKEKGSPEQDGTDGHSGKTEGANGSAVTEIQPKKIKGFGFGDIFKDKAIKLRPRSMEIELDNPIDKPSTKKVLPVMPTQESSKSEPDSRAKGKEYCKVLFPYEAQNEDELTIKEGDIVIIRSKECADAGWWEGETNGKHGVFPDNFVKLLPPDFEKERPKKPPPPSAPGIKPLSGPKPDCLLTDKRTESKRIPPERPETLPTRIEDKDKSERDQAKPSVPAIPPKKPLPPKTNSLTRPNTLPPRRPERPVIPTGHNRSDSDSKSELGVSIILCTSERESLEKTNDIDVGSFDSVVSSTEKLNHPTASRPKASGRRPPSQVFTSPSLSSPDYLDSPIAQEDEREEQEKIELDCSTTKVKRAPRPIPALPTSDKTALPPKPGHSVLPSGCNPHATMVPTFHHTIASGSGQRPNSPSKFNTDMKPKSDKSQDAIEELRTQVKELRTFIELMKSQHKKEITQLMNELDEEKKIRISLQCFFNSWKWKELRKHFNQSDGLFPGCSAAVTPFCDSRI